MYGTVLRQAPRAMSTPLRAPSVASLLTQARWASSESDAAAERRYIAFDSDVSPQLKPILEEIQNKIILPKYLSAAQHERITKPQHQQSLKTNPVIIEIDDITHQFSYLPEKDMPKTGKSLLQAIKYMETDTDRAQLVRLFAGLRHANRRLDAEMLRRVTRLLGSKGAIYAAIDLARQVKKTNFAVCTPDIANEMLFWVQLRALEANWAGAPTVTSYKWVREVATMAASPNHTSRFVNDRYHLPLQRDPVVLLADLHVSSALALGARGDQNINGGVEDVARQLIHIWPRGTPLIEVWPEKQRSKHNKVGGPMHWLKDTKANSPIAVAHLSMYLHGLRLSQRILEPSLAEHMGSLADVIQAQLNQAKEGLEKFNPGSVPDRAYNGQFDADGNIKFDPAPEVKEAKVEEPVAEAEAEPAAESATAEEAEQK